VKKINLTKGVFAVLLLASTAAVAETEYPATDFKPAILFQDLEANEAAKKNKPSVAAKPSVQSEAKSSVQSKEESPVSAAAEPSVSSTTESSNLNALIGLAVFAAAGFFFFTRQSKKCSKSERTSFGGLTGVARYLKNLDKTAGTGVSRYLEKQVAATKGKTGATGVEKYLRDRG
jgi:hypothetical protein